MAASQTGRNRAGWVLAGVALGAAGAAGIGMTGQESRWKGPGYEYAEFVYLGPDRGAVVVTDDAEFKLPPPAVDRGQRNRAGNLVVERLDLKLELLNQVGANGWRVVGAETIEPGVRYLLVRQR